MSFRLYNALLGVCLLTCIMRVCSCAVCLLSMRHVRVACQLPFRLYGALLGARLMEHAPDINR